MSDAIEDPGARWCAASCGETFAWPFVDAEEDDGSVDLLREGRAGEGGDPAVPGPETVLALALAPNDPTEPAATDVAEEAEVAPAGVAPELLDKFLFLRRFGFVWILECLVNSSDLENRLLQPGNEHR